jgi:hypothetical protein
MTPLGIISSIYPALWATNDFSVPFAPSSTPRF